MNSLEILKNELIAQRKLLEQKGFPVTVSNANPTPTEITNAIDDIEMDFTKTTATEADVMEGKTFFSQNNEIKTGTFRLAELDDLDSFIKCFITGQGSYEIVIPSYASTIRQYAFHTSADYDSNNLFYAHDLYIPPTLTHVCMRAFYRANITGTLIIPTTLTTIDTQAFNNINITELEINAGLTSDSTYAFCNCSKLKKVTINNLTSLPSYLFDYCTSLEEVVLPPKLSTYPKTIINKCSAMKRLWFTGERPPSFVSTAMQSFPTLILLVPYEYYDSYFNASNYQAYNNPIYGYGVFEKGRNLPSSDGTYTIVWYPSLEDLQANTNAITEAPETTTLYGLYTEIATESETEE